MLMIKKFETAPEVIDENPYTNSPRKNSAQRKT